MQFWQTLLKEPSGEQAMDDFAQAIGKIHKIVFSSTLKETNGDTAELAKKSLEQTVLELKKQAGIRFK